MQVTITGGAGFLGLRLARRLLAGRPTLERLRLVDQVGPPDGFDDVTDDPRVEVMVGNLIDTGFVDRTLDDGGGLTVYHLASVVSAGAELDFDLGYAVNLHGTLSVLERCRRLRTAAGTVRVAFASSLATYGSDAAHPVGDSSTQRPETSYGVQKVCGELLINDYHRKGFIDGWTLRLPTVVVRPGKPNLAASGFASGIIREPLAGVDAVCPVDPDTVMAVISPRRVIDAFDRILDLQPEALAADRAVLLPGLAMRVSEALEATKAEAGDRVLGRVSFEPDAQIQQIVDSWPPSLVSDRATHLGMGGDQSVAAIVRQHIEDEVEG